MYMKFNYILTCKAGTFFESQHKGLIQGTAVGTSQNANASHPPVRQRSGQAPTRLKGTRT